jgi:microcystin-dependent protein
MADQFLAEIRIFPFAYAPKGWALCDGQILPISQNTALFSLINSYFGGNGVNTFGLPNMQGNVPIHVGQGPGLSPYNLGQRGGTPIVTLLPNEMPSHSHTVESAAPNFAGTTNVAGGNSFAKSAQGNAYTAPGAFVNMSAAAVTMVGSGGPHNNMMPYLTLSFCIALQGIFPVRP